MSIRKLLLPLTGTAAGEAALLTALGIARMWEAHVLALHVRIDSRDVAPLAGEGLSGAMIEEMMSATEKESGHRARAVETMFDRFVLANEVALAEPHAHVSGPTASFAAVTGREEDIVAQQARLADLTVVPHPEAGEDVSSSDALHAVLFELGPAGAGRAADSLADDRHQDLSWLERHRRVGLGGRCGPAMAETGRGGPHSLGRYLSAARPRRTRTRRLSGDARGRG